MAEIINLRRFKKHIKHNQKVEKAAENRAHFGRTKAEKQNETMEREKAERLHQGHRRQTENHNDDNLDGNNTNDDKAE